MPPVYDADAEDFLRWPPLLRDPLGAELVDAAAPQRGERVLDACSGAGGSALPAARRVGAAGRVDAVDLTTHLVQRPEVAAKQAGLQHLHAHTADVTNRGAMAFVGLVYEAVGTVRPEVTPPLRLRHGWELVADSLIATGHVDGVVAA
ncbi:class I SAM-dependent methyltransferase [Kribbella amoyensis]|uniref:class I SAM-dependent methyltransferase n=1 Tax=Kribbella amoyensis TaxID=996641 RepID=UPI0011A722C5|nr:class I SAM-dependent methyltransferase [Kribbella amoyensis]